MVVEASALVPLNAWMLCGVFALHAWPKVSTAALLTFGWTVCCSTLVWLIPMDLPVGFAMALPPLAGWLWVRGSCPLLAVQVAQAVSGARSTSSLAEFLLGHILGALAAVCCLQRAESLAGVQGLVPNPQLGTGVSPFTGMLYEACGLLYLALTVALLPNLLVSRGLPKGLVLSAVFPVMRGLKNVTGPALQPVIALSVKLVVEGPASALEAAVPFGVGPMLGAVALGVAMRGRRMPFQTGYGVPVELAMLETGKKKQA